MDWWNNQAVLTHKFLIIFAPIKYAEDTKQAGSDASESDMLPSLLDSATVMNANDASWFTCMERWGDSA